jgi:putative endonuclease
MSEHTDLGKRGEKMAVEHLIKKGFNILKQNYFFGKAEVDIVAEINNQLVFVEVKTRQSSYLSDPEYTVSMRKQRQIIKASDAYIKEFDLDQEARFDIITIIVNGQYSKLDHLEDAFYPSL